MSIATARTWAQRTGPSSSKNGLISALERPRPTHSTRLRSGSTTTVAYRWPFWIANSSIASSRTPSRFGGPSERSDSRSAFLDLRHNLWLWTAIALSALLQVAVVHLPPLNSAFSTVPLDAGQWLVCLLMASTVLWYGELRKLLWRNVGRRLYGRRQQGAP